MRKKLIWVVVSCLMALSLLLLSCGTAEEEEKTEGPGIVVKEEVKGEEEQKQEEKVVEEEQEKEVVSSEQPRYGGRLRIVINREIGAFDDVIGWGAVQGTSLFLTNEDLWGGDWTKGNAGGYGEGLTDWSAHFDVFSHKGGYVAESWEFSIDEENSQGTIVYNIRPGMYWSLDADNAVSARVGGREVVAEDVVKSLQNVTTDDRAYIHRTNPQLRDLEITATGKYQVSMTVPLDAMIAAKSRFGDFVHIFPADVTPEESAEWKNAVGSGAFILKDYVAAGSARLDRNPNYYRNNPLGPGTGDQLPYLDGVDIIIMPDPSTRLAAIRTGKIDQIAAISWEDAALLREQVPELLEGPSTYLDTSPTFMRTDKEPFNDIRVRKAMMMATDFNAIRDELNNGQGVIITWPFELYSAYEAAYLGLGDPDMPAEIAELYVYNPDKAKELLAEAGYPDGFKTEVAIQSQHADYYSVLASMWAKVGIVMELNVLETGAHRALASARNYPALMTDAKGPISTFYLAFQYTGGSRSNGSMVDDPFLNAEAKELATLAATDLDAAMVKNKEIMKYVLAQAYAIPRPAYRASIFWWPWLKNYSGELTLGYFTINKWADYIWYDEEMKSAMGY